MSMFEEIPVEVGIIFEGERIRRKDMQVELGGPKQEHSFELARVKKLEEIRRYNYRSSLLELYLDY